MTELEGVSVTGRLVSASLGREYKLADGTMLTPYQVELMIPVTDGRHRIQVVEFKSAASAQEALGAAKLGELVTVRCTLRLAQAKGGGFIAFHAIEA